MGEGVKLYEPRMSWRETVASGGDASGARGDGDDAGRRPPAVPGDRDEDGTVAAFDVVASAASGLTIERNTIQPRGAEGDVASALRFALGDTGRVRGDTPGRAAARVVVVPHPLWLDFTTDVRTRDIHERRNLAL